MCPKILGLNRLDMSSDTLSSLLCKLQECTKAKPGFEGTLLLPSLIIWVVNSIMVYLWKYNMVFVLHKGVCIYQPDTVLSVWKKGAFKKDSLFTLTMSYPADQSLELLVGENVMCNQTFFGIFTMLLRVVVQIALLLWSFKMQSNERKGSSVGLQRLLRNVN